jgi:hypothetical protein
LFNYYNTLYSCILIFSLQGLYCLLPTQLISKHHINEDIFRFVFIFCCSLGKHPKNLNVK